MLGYVNLNGTAAANAKVDVIDDCGKVRTAVADSMGRWSISAAAFPVGMHQLRARATDGNGRVETSRPVSVRVYEADDIQVSASDETIDDGMALAESLFDRYTTRVAHDQPVEAEDVQLVLRILGKSAADFFEAVQQRKKLDSISAAIGLSPA